jgi:diacylglycerol kinase family enzyme
MEEAAVGGYFHLVIGAGGDGTSREALNALFDGPADVLERMAVLRLPFGTGNDGADARSIDDALRLLTQPTQRKWQSAVLLETANHNTPLRAFNILSLGLDAFVTRMTNKMKNRLPGDSYKLWVNLAALFYNRIYPVGEMTVRAHGADGMTTWRERELLLALGASGGRTYGGGERILPDERNLCAVREMSVLRKMAIKGAVATGGHGEFREVRLLSARRVEVAYAGVVPAQADGESIVLTAEDFPVVLSLSTPVIPCLGLSALVGR